MRITVPHFLTGAARNAGWLSVGEAAVKGGVLLAGVLIARGMGPGPMGLFTVSYGVALLLTQLFAAGQVEVLIREVARQPELARHWFAVSSSWQRRTALPIALAGSLGIVFLARPALRWTLLGFLAYAWIRSRLITAGAVFKGLERMDMEVKARAIELLTALVILAAIVRWHLPPSTMGAAFALGAAVGLTWIATQLPRDRSAAAPAVHPPDFRSEGLAFVGLSALLQLLLRGDTLVMAGLGLRTELIGQYGAALMPVLAAIAVPQLLAVALYPILSRAAGSGDSPLKWTAFCGGLGVAAGLVTAILFATAGSRIVPLFYGARYLPAIPLMTRAAWILPGASGFMMLGVVLAAWRRQRISLVILLAVTLPLLAADLAVIPRAGLPGAITVAIAAHSATALLALAAAAIVLRRSSTP